MATKKPSESEPTGITDPVTGEFEPKPAEAVPEAVILSPEEANKSAKEAAEEQTVSANVGVIVSSPNAQTPSGIVPEPLNQTKPAKKLTDLEGNPIDPDKKVIT